MTLKLRSLPLATLPMKNWLQNLHHRGPAWHTTTVDVDVIYEHSSKLIQSCGRGPWNQLYVCLYGWKIIV